MFVVSLFLLPVISIFTRDLVNWPCNGRNLSTRSVKRVSALTRGKFSVHVTRSMQGAIRVFFFISNSKYPCRVDIGIPQSRYLTFSIRQMTEVVSRREHCCKLQQTCHEESSSSQECFSTFNRGLLRLSKSCRKLIFVTSSIFATGRGKVASAYSQ